MTDGQLKAFEVPVIGVSISAVLDKAQQRSMVFQTHFPQDCEPQEINKVLDVCSEVLERQHDVFKYSELQREIVVLQRHIDGATSDLARIDAQHHQKWLDDNRKGPLRLAAPQEAARHNAVANLEHGKKELAFAREQLKVLEKRIKNGADRTDASH